VTPRLPITDPLVQTAGRATLAEHNLAAGMSVAWGEQPEADHFLLHGTAAAVQVVEAAITSPEAVEAAAQALAGILWNGQWTNISTDAQDRCRADARAAIEAAIAHAHQDTP